jgi:hypothetical protein
MKRQAIFGLGAAVLVVGLGATVQADPAVSPCQAALNAAATDGKYVFILFHKEEDDATRSMRKTLAAVLAGKPGQATTAQVKTTDPAEKALLDRYGLDRAPLPLILAVAPNGAVTGGFPLKVSEQEIASAFVSPTTATCLKAIQSRKLVLLCVQPAGMTDLPAGVRSFQADTQYGPSTEVVTVRADDEAEAGFLKTFRITPSDQPVTAFLAPPGRLLGVFAGAVTREQLVEKLKAAQGGCCPGGKCGPSGCCSGGQAEPKK